MKPLSEGVKRLSEGVKSLQDDFFACQVKQSLILRSILLLIENTDCVEGKMVVECF